MSKEEFLREAMTRAAGSNEPPVGDAFMRFQRRRSRGNFIRGVVVSTLGIGVVLALVFALPGLNPKTDSFSVAPLSPTLTTYVDPIAGFQIDYPHEWTAAGVPGKKATFHPAFVGDESSLDQVARGTRGFVELPRQFFVSVDAQAVYHEECPPNRTIECPAFTVSPFIASSEQASSTLAPLGVRVSSRRESVAGLNVPVLDLLYPDGAAPYGREVKWCRSCRDVTYFLDWSTRFRLYVRVVAPNEATFERYNSVAQSLVASLSHYPVGPVGSK